MRNALQSLLLLVSLIRCWCIGPDWNNHPIMQQTGDEKIEPYTLAHMNVTYRDRSTGELRSDKKDVAKFGEYHVAQVTGILVHVRSEAGDEPYTACSLPLRPSYGEFPTNERWIALVKRGKCNFQQKVENAFHSNASGIIIYNDKEVPNLEKMRLQRNVPRIRRPKYTMEALKLVSIYIFNGMSRLVHRRRSLPGRPFQLPYPTSYRQMTLQSYGRNEMSAEDVITPDDVPAIRQPSGPPGAAPPTEAAAGDSTAAAGGALATPVIEARPGAASQLLSDEYQLKRFMERLEEETLKLLEPTEEGIKVPRPVPYPAYLARPPEIPISQTYTSVLRQLYNERRAAYSRSDFPTVVRQHPKKPKVPPYLPSDIVELRQRTVKVLLTSQNSDLESGGEHGLAVAFGRAAKRRRSAKGAR